MDNPRIYRGTGSGATLKTRLLFDVYVKASVDGTYLNFTQILDEIILSHFKLICKFSDLKDWERGVVNKVLNPKYKVTIAVIGKYIELQDAYKSIYEALIHAGIYNDARVEIKRIDSESLEKDKIDQVLKGVSGIKKRDDTHKMAESNKAFAHFRW